jgi:hypothetical protein
MGLFDPCSILDEHWSRVFYRKRQRADGDGRTTLVTLLNQSSRVRGRSLATSVGSLSNGNRGPTRTEKPVSNSNGHHVSTLGERDEVPLSNPSFFAEKKREGNALGLLTRSMHGQRFLEAQIHTHNYFLISKAHRGPYTGTTLPRPSLRVRKRPRAKKSGWWLSLSCVNIKGHRPRLGTRQWQ